MPLVVNVGLNRKASRDFQSFGCSINLSAELCSALINDPSRLQAEVAKVYAQAQVALESQVQSMTVTGTSTHDAAPGSSHRNQNDEQGRGLQDIGGGVPMLAPVTVTADAPLTLVGQGAASDHRHRHQSRGGSLHPTTVPHLRQGSFGGAVRPATASQLRALHSICKRMNLRLDHEVHEEFGLESVDELDVKSASVLISRLKERQGQVVQQRRWS
jgi:hypothetical protein